MQELFAVEWSDRDDHFHIQELSKSLVSYLKDEIVNEPTENTYKLVGIVTSMDNGNKAIEILQQNRNSKRPLSATHRQHLNKLFVTL